MKKTELGAWGENLAAAQLEKEGYRIRERNFRCRLGEIDIIAQKGDILAFVEVKLRKSSSHGEAREFVTASKQQKLRMTASFFLAGRPWGVPPLVSGRGGVPFNTGWSPNLCFQ